MKPDSILRDLRWAHKLNQRELAERARLPHSTIARIESGQTHDPRWGTLLQILESLGYEIAVLDRHGAVLAPRPMFEGAALSRDKIGRRLPAHLPAWRLRNERDGWWGWRRVAWLPDDPGAPPFGYRGRAKRRGNAA